MTTTTPEKITTAMKIDGIVDAVMTRIRDAGDSLGIVQVVERDEMPAYVESGDCYIIPLVEGKDVMRTRIGGSGGGIEHQFVLTVVAYFKADSIDAGIRSTRGAGYGVLDLFYGGHDAEMIEAFVTVPPVDEEEEEEEEEEIGGDGDDDPGEPEQEPVGEYVVAHTYDPVLEVGYARITDYVLHWFIATIRIKVVI